MVVTPGRVSRPWDTAVLVMSPRFAVRCEDRGPPRRACARVLRTLTGRGAPVEWHAPRGAPRVLQGDGSAKDRLADAGVAARPAPARARGAAGGAGSGAGPGPSRRPRRAHSRSRARRAEIG